MSIPQIDVVELETRLAAGAVLLDVRNREEWESARIEGGVLVPLPELADRLDEVPDGEILVVCHSGGRSQRAAEFLAQHGRSPSNVAGGTAAWIESGRPVASGASDT